MGSGIGKKRKGSIDMGITGYDSKDWEAYRWCVNNGIAIAPKAKSTTEWYVVITNKGSTNQSPESYEKTVIWQKIFEYCKYYYEKHRK
tara:strand:+ start:86 stop:349 length:264 start_codon:yes stop_codon:yes gene_type:complete